MSIAIVGNSGSLLKNEYGKLIDGHNHIIRFNDAPTLGYEQHVGSKKAWMRMIAYHGADYSLVDEDILLYSYNKKALKEGFDKLNKHNLVLKMDKELIRECDDMISKPYWKWWLKQKLGFGRTIVHKRMSSSGLKAVIMALGSGEINLFGFDTEKLNKQFHYWEDRENYNPDDSHDYGKEMQIIKGFEREGKLNIWS